MMSQRYFLASAAFILLCFVWVRAGAQERPSWGAAVSFSNGTFIQTGIGTVPPGAAGVNVSKASVATTALSTMEGDVFRRILRLSDGRAIVYEIAVKRLADGKQFAVTLGSWKPTPEEARGMRIDPARVESNFLSNYSSPLTINEGDTLAVDVLFNPRTGVKLVDYFRVTSRQPSSLSGVRNHTAAARPLKIGDVEFYVENFELRLNGKPIYTHKGAMGGRYIWIDVPHTGRFIFSLTPLSEADGFRRSAYLTRQQIVFTDRANNYELTSERPIIQAAGVFNLWMRFDPTFGFPSPASHQAGNYFSIGAADRLPLQQRRE